MENRNEQDIRKMEFYKQVFGEFGAVGDSNVGGNRSKKEDERREDKYMKIKSDSDSGSNGQQDNKF